MGLFFGALIAWIVAIWVHEFGHYLAARHYGLPPAYLQIGAFCVLKITIVGVPHRFGLLPLVGFVPLPDGLSLRQQSLVALAGPLASFLTGLPVMGLARGTGSLWLAALAVFSLLGGACNFIPVPPSDGWRIAEIFAERRGNKFSDVFRYFVAFLFYGGLGALMVLS